MKKKKPPSYSSTKYAFFSSARYYYLPRRAENERRRAPTELLYLNLNSYYVFEELWENLLSILYVRRDGCWQSGVTLALAGRLPRRDGFAGPFLHNAPRLWRVSFVRFGVMFNFKYRTRRGARVAKACISVFSTSRKNVRNNK